MSLVTRTKKAGQQDACSGSFCSDQSWNICPNGGASFVTATRRPRGSDKNHTAFCKVKLYRSFAFVLVSSGKRVTQRWGVRMLFPESQAEQSGVQPSLLQLDIHANPVKGVCFSERRLEQRVELVVAALVVPMEGEVPDTARAFTAIAKDISNKGIGLIAHHFRMVPEVLICVWSDGELKLLHAAVRYRKELTRGWIRFRRGSPPHCGEERVSRALSLCWIAPEALVVAGAQVKQQHGIAATLRSTPTVRRQTAQTLLLAPPAAI